MSGKGGKGARQRIDARQRIEGERWEWTEKGQQPETRQREHSLFPPHLNIAIGAAEHKEVVARDLLRVAVAARDAKRKGQRDRERKKRKGVRSCKKGLALHHASSGTRLSSLAHDVVLLHQHPPPSPT